MKKIHLLLITLFIVLYSAFVFKVNLNITIDLAGQVIVAATFFFALFSGFFIVRQNERFTRIVDIIAERDGLYSCLYRVFGLVPRIQSEIREAIRTHYTKILDNNNWAYNEFHPSITITRIVKAMGSTTDDEANKLKNNNLFDGIWGVIQQLQINRKKIVAAYQERLLPYQWILIYTFAILTVISFHFLQTDLFWFNVVKIVFGTAVFLVVILIKQLNDLAVFGEDFSRNIAKDVLRIIEEMDIKELGEKDQLGESFS